MKIFHATGLLRYQGLQENHKRTTKVMKVKTKARDKSIPKFEKKIIFLGSFSVSCLQFFVFSSYKVIKAKKATLVAENANLHLGFFIGQKLLLYHPKALFKLPFTKNRAGKSKQTF